VEGGEGGAFGVGEVVVPEVVSYLMEPDAVEFLGFVEPDGS